MLSSVDCERASHLKLTDTCTDNTWILQDSRDPVPDSVPQQNIPRCALILCTTRSEGDSLTAKNYCVNKVQMGA